jgi:hypothetical protein
MTKKKKPATKVVEPVEQIDTMPPEELPVVQLEEPVELETIQKPELEPVQETEPEKPAQVEPIIAESPDSNEPHIPILGPKPKNLSMTYLQEEIDYLSYQITELLKNPVRQRKPVESSRKVQMLDKVSGKIYPSKNNLYLSMLKSGELKELVDKGIFGSNPEKNTFGVYALLRAWPTRFEPVQSQEANVA